jgi:hypothetical protein
LVKEPVRPRDWLPEQDCESARLFPEAFEASHRTDAALPFDPTDEAPGGCNCFGVAGVGFECFPLE